MAKASRDAQVRRIGATPLVIQVSSVAHLQTYLAGTDDIRQTECDDGHLRQAIDINHLFGAVYGDKKSIAHCPMHGSKGNQTRKPLAESRLCRLPGVLQSASRGVGTRQTESGCAT